MVVHVQGRAGGASYSIEEVECDGSERLWLVTKVRTQDEHWVSLNGLWWSCCCGDFEFRRADIDPRGCRHIQSVKALLGYPAIHFDHYIDLLEGGNVVRSYDPCGVGNEALMG